MMTRFMDDPMNEVIRYGGMAARRFEVYDHALAALLSRPDCPSRQAAKKGADAFAFGARAVALTLAQAAALPLFDPATGKPVVPYPGHDYLDKVRAYEVAERRARIVAYRKRMGLDPETGKPIKDKP